MGFIGKFKDKIIVIKDSKSVQGAINSGRTKISAAKSAVNQINMPKINIKALKSITPKVKLFSKNTANQVVLSNCYKIPRRAKEINANKSIKKWKGIKSIENIKFPKPSIKTIKNIKAPSLNLKAPTLPSLDIKSKASKIANNFSKDFEYRCDMAVNLLSFYNLRHESVLGVDITPHCIYLCQIDGLNGKRVLTSLTSVCMEGKFMTEDIVNNCDDYADSLKSLIKANNIQTKNVALSIPVSSSVVRTVTIPQMDDNEIKKALKFGSLWNNFMHPDKNPEDYSIFYQVIRRDASNETMDILFVATKLSDISLYTDIVIKSGLNPIIVDVRCFAISNAFNHQLSSESSPGPNVFIEFGFEENYAMIIDNDTSQIFDIYITDAQRTALIDEVLDEEIIDEFVERYAKQIKHTIAQYEEKHDTDKVKNIFVLSSIALTQTIVDKLTEALPSYSISECNFFSCMDITDDFTISAQSAEQRLSSWTAAIGTALRTVNIFGTSKVTAQYNNTNLLPTAGNYERSKRIKYVTNALSAVASIALLLFVVSTQGSISERDKYLSSQLASLEGVETKYNINNAKGSKLELALNGVDEINGFVSNIGSSQNNLLAAHQYLNLVILDDIWLKELQFTSPDKLEIKGSSVDDQSILEFIELLNEGNQFSKVSLRLMEEVKETNIQEGISMAVKSFKLESVLSDSPMVDYNENNMMAGEINHGT